MKLNEKFEVEFKNKYSSQQRNLLLNAIKDLYINLNDYEINIYSASLSLEDFENIASNLSLI